MDYSIAIAETIKIDDLNENLAFVAEMTDLETVKKIITRCGGGQIHVPYIKNMTAVVDRFILDNLDKFEDRQELMKLASDLHFTRGHIVRKFNLIQEASRKQDRPGAPHPPR